MKKGERMSHWVVVGLLGVALAASAQGQAKDQALSLDEKYEKLKAGILKFKEADVVRLFGPPQTLKRPGPLQADLEMAWEYTTRITVTYKEGKVNSLTGTFSAHLAVERVTPDKFRRVRVGMTEAEVVDVLGGHYAKITIDGVVSGQWGATARILAAFRKDGLLLHHELTGNSYGPQKR
jgi:hypothetical protein